MLPQEWATLLHRSEQGEAFHLIDTETTGLRALSDRVIELATVTVRDGRIVDRFETLIDPDVAIPPHITSLTGISAPMLDGAPAPTEAYRRWLAYLERLPGHFVAHNVRFDWDFLRAEFARASLTWPFSKGTCTVRLARYCLPQLRKHGLESLIRHFGIRVSDRHRALADVEATAEVFVQCLALLRERAGTAPRPVPETPSTPLPEPEWTALLAHLKAHSNITAAMLAQHANAASWEEGALVLRVTPVYQPRLAQEAARFAMVEAAVRAVYGQEVALRIEAAS
jgi:DNA polymerase III epsilon subunit family exonuclease